MKAIRATFEFSSSLKRKFKENVLSLDLSPGTTIRDALLSLEYQEGDLKFLVAFREGERVPLTYKVQDGDRIRVLLPIGGG